MFAVEIYAAVRRFVFIEGKSQREAARVFGLSRDTIAKPLFGAARLCAIQGSGAAKARTARTGNRRDSGVRQDGTAEAAAHREADFRTAAARTRICRRLYRSEGLRSDRPQPVARGLRAAGPSAWPCAGRLRRMLWRRRRRTDEAACVLLRPAAFGRLLHQGLSGGDDGSFSGWAHLGICLFRRRAAVDFVR